MEIWKAIEGYEGIYEASIYGRLRSLDRHRIMKGANKDKEFTYKRFHKGRILAGGLDKNGYRIGVFYDSEGKRRTLKFHRLIAQTFIPNPEGLPQVNHKDGVKDNNHIDNLEWITGSGNVRHGIETGLTTFDTCKKPVAMLDKDTLKVIKIYESAQATVKDGFNRGHVGGCCRGDYGRNTHKGYKWKFLDDFEGPTTIESTSKDGSE